MATTTETNPVMSEEPPPQDIPGITRPMTYEEYLASPEEMARYDIIDGWKVYRLYGDKQVTNPTIRHQRIQSRVARALERYEEISKAGLAVLSPCDVLVIHHPIRTRQPDVLFISHARLSGRSLDDPAPLSPAPELVVEILSPSDTRRVQQEKIADYCAVGVLECWLISIADATVEVLRLSPEGAETLSVYKIGQTVASVTFSELNVPVDDIFAE